MAGGEGTGPGRAAGDNIHPHPSPRQGTPSNEQNRPFPLAMPTEGWMKEAADTLGRKPAAEAAPARPQTCACELGIFDWTRPWDRSCLQF